MYKLYFLLVLFSFSFNSPSVLAQNILFSCGDVGTFNDRLIDCRKKNSNNPDYTEKLEKGFQLFTVVDQESYWLDIKTEWVWGPQYSKKDKQKKFFKRRCKKPYKRAKRRHYRKMSHAIYEKKKGYYNCIAKLKNYILIPTNRYLYFK